MATSAFGQSATQQPAGGLFGQSTQQQSTGGLFGQTTQQPTNTLFGQPSAQQGQQAGGIFGQSTAGSSTAQPVTGGLFSQPSTQPSGGGLFSQSTIQPASGGGLFGQSTAQPAASGGGLFGQPAAQPAAGGGLFGQTTTQNTGGGVFAQSTSQPAVITGGLFGQSTTQNTGSGLFGQSTTQPSSSGLFSQSTTQPSNGGLFGQSTTQPASGGVFGQTITQPAGGSLFGGSTLQAQPTLPAGGLFGNNQLQQNQTPTGLLLSKSTKFNDLPDETKRIFEGIDSYIQGRLQISKDLHQRKLGEEPLKAQELLQGIRKDLMNISAHTRDDYHLTNDMKSQVDQAVQDTIVAIRLVDAFKAPQGSGTSYLNTHANFPYEFFTRVTEKMRQRLVWYKATIEQIERKLSSSTSQSQTPHGIAATLQAQHATFLSLASKTAALDAEFQKIKVFVTQIWRAKTGSVRDPFNELDRTSDSTEFGAKAILMEYPHHQQLQQDFVSGEQYRYALTNFRLAHEKVEQQRKQLEEQERQVAQLRERIAILEGGPVQERHGPSGNSIDDFSIKSAASQLDKLINRWSADIVQRPPSPLQVLARAALVDIIAGLDVSQFMATPMQAQFLLRHALSETISEGIINCLIITNSSEANVQLTRIHEHIFARDPIVASVWRRQTFSAAVETCTPEMSLSILYEQIPELMKHLNGALPTSGSTSGDAFYRAFVPEIASPLYPRQIELVKRCLKSERGELDRVGATIFPGLVKLTRGPSGENIQTVVRRAQVVCECAMGPMPVNAQPVDESIPQPLQMPEGQTYQNGAASGQGLVPQTGHAVSVDFQNGLAGGVTPQSHYGAQGPPSDSYPAPDGQFYRSGPI
ncbi:hypothetical protein C0993_000139 [Termitomyces sp. T159_Od127]|nr:hypothetical protein C0993_000139 [Termitomyces sp. T159_Od127]